MRHRRTNPNLRLRLLLVFALIGCAGIGWADDLFTIERPVADEGTETRNAMLSEQLAVVLVRVSGNPAVAAQPAAREILDSAPSLVQQYRYRTVEQQGETVRLLSTRFDRNSVERMMRERNLPVWTQRPRVVMWLGKDEGGQRSLVNFDAEPGARAAVVTRAQERGMPLQLPLMDLEDQTALMPADLWSDYAAGLSAASARYLSDVVLAGRLRAAGEGRWIGSWTLFDGDVVQRFESTARGLDQSLTWAVDQAQDRLAVRYAPQPTPGGVSGTLVRFSGIYDLVRYGALVSAVETLPVVERAALRAIDGDAFTFELALRGDPQELIRALDAAGPFAAEPAPFRGGRPDDPALPAPLVADLHYRLTDN